MRTPLTESSKAIYLCPSATAWSGQEALVARKITPRFACIHSGQRFSWALVGPLS
jgi:hypothetical protein